MINHNRKRGRTPIKVKVPQFSPAKGHSRRTCKYCSGNSRYHPETQVFETDDGWICSFHYMWRWKHELEHESSIDLEENFDER